MRLLLDTHAFLWAISDDPRLGSMSRELVAERAEAVTFSLVSLWEIAIKHSLGRGDMPISAGQALAWMEASRFEPLTVAAKHILTLEQLPQHHRDPFDRLLVAQAISESLTLLSADSQFHAYGCPLVDARQ
jgi:PIN domain nuclease of toxin-antitoxin system